MDDKYLVRRIRQIDRRGSVTTMALTLLVLAILACSCPQMNKNGNGNKSGNTNQKKGNNTAPDDGDFIVKDVPLENPKYASIEKSLKENRTLENAADELNSKLALPNDITLMSKSCGTPNAYYSPDDRSLTICYELMEHFYKLDKAQGKSDDEANVYMNDAITFVFCHELGHGLIDIYNLPATGKEEDAVDQLATYISCEEMGERGEKAAVAGAMSFYYQSKGRNQTADVVFADEHSLDKQRFYNILCWLYGHDTSKYANIVSDGILPESRAQRCPGEYDKLSNAWKQQLAAYRKD
jgi:hypothetical protein